MQDNNPLLGESHCDDERPGLSSYCLRDGLSIKCD